MIVREGWRQASLETTANRPALTEPETKCAKRDSKVLGPILKASGFTPESKHASAAIVAVLDPSCRPAAVLGGVMTSVINAVKGVFGRGALSHIGQKGREGIAPSLAHSYPPAAVVLIRAVIAVLASLLHRVPGTIFRRVGLTMLAVMKAFSLETTAGLARAISHAAQPDSGFFPTPATAADKPAFGFIVPGMAQYG